MQSLILVILVMMPDVWCGDWRMTFKNQCALKGTSVVIKCEYDYPLGHIVTSVGWYKAQRVSDQWRLFPLSNLPSPPDHFRYVGNYRNDCSLEINDVQYTDNGAYVFTHKWRNETFAQLSVKELTTVVQPNTVTEGDNVRLICVSGCPTPTAIVWFRDGQAVPNSVFQARREDAGRYYCAVLGQETVRSASVALNVQYRPVNISVAMDPPHVVEGSSVNLTCSSAANPAADNYTWYKTASPSSSSMLQVGSGQVLSLPSVEASHTGLYLCQARNQLGESNSTEVLLAMKEEEHGGMSLPILAGLGVSLFVTLVLVKFLFCRKQRTCAEKKQTVFHFRHSGRGSSSSATEDQSNSIYVNIHMLPSSPPPVTDITPHSQRNSRREHDAPTSSEDEVTYSTVTIKPRNPSLPHDINTSRAPQDSSSKAGENDDSVIYATVAKSR
ncbi:carcinoembryonic antigen-related cell adhesion molecule 6-like [Siniperca chuatsi]|uniref:carcinoembryonic antigen-related cell adhesion molecule 6-like n=1 Tax=Siniperca chuatsi TaxID=119488 RepID=UPI001CE02C34|nr:carcinoembryonic antigen-related cell adhesion molecule 6-like [Siniperca chuatsi]